MLNICLLKCNVYNYKKNIVDLYKNLFDIEIKKVYDCLNNEIPSDKEIKNFDIFIITGARCIEVLCNEKKEMINILLILIRKILDNGKKIYATCFGHQILSHFFGATISRRCIKNEWEIGLINLKLNKPTKKLIENINELTIMTTHRDYVNNINETNLLPLTKDSHTFLITIDKKNKIQTISCQGHFLFNKSYFLKDKKGFFNRPYPIKYTNNFINNQLEDKNIQNKYILSRDIFKSFLKKYLIENVSINTSIIDLYKSEQKNSKEIIPKC